MSGDTSSGATQDVAGFSQSLAAGIGRSIVGKEEAITLATVALLARGHLLIEDVPGTGKTSLARAIAHSLGCEFRRIQFTPDLVPADIVGVNVFHPDRAQFDFRPGPLFANVVLADEINRATPRTQSALLEAMAEGQASVDGETYPLPTPFLVIATQNPVEMDGTFRLPEAQLDRFLLRLEVGYPEPEEEDRLLERHLHGPVDSAALEPVTSAQALVAAQDAVTQVDVSAAVREYIRRIAHATRAEPRLRLGVSPRGALSLQRAAQGLAALQGRTYVLPDDLKRLAPAVLAHRVIVDAAAHLRGSTAEAIVGEVVESVAVPMSAPDG